MEYTIVYNKSDNRYEAHSRLQDSDEWVQCGKMVSFVEKEQAQEWVDFHTRDVDKVEEKHFYLNCDLVGTRLFNGPTGCICVVALYDTIGKYWVSYIGVSTGDDMSTDALIVAAKGVKLEPDVARSMFPYMNINEYKPY